MILQMHIRDLAIIDTLELELAQGMTVLTGETGAGKSILIDALGLVLGDRADSSMVREGAEKAEISVTLALPETHSIQAWLQTQGMEAEETCILRRSISRDGKSRAWINGTPATRQNLQTLSEWLVDIHGQHAHQSLLRQDMQRQVLDAYAAHKTLLEHTASAHAHWQQLHAELSQRQARQADQQARREWVALQLAELHALGISADELRELNQEHHRLAHAQTLLTAAQGAYALLSVGEHSIERGLHQAHALLGEAAGFDPTLAAMTQNLSEAQIHISEAVQNLGRYLDRLELDPARLAWIEQRLAEIHSLARKHQRNPAELLDLQEILSSELAALDAHTHDLKALTQEAAQAEQDYLSHAQALSQSRTLHAARLETAVTEAMQSLGMPGGCFAIELSPLSRERFSPLGLDTLSFCVSANPGLAPRPLAKVASGGELSRISLAIQMVAAHVLATPTLIFDEVDAGIGGAVAEIVGRQLRALGEHRQVLCVTHLPQVAAQAHHHLHVSKQHRNGHTHTQLRSLDEAERIEELARMLGGIDITEQTLAHAREMRHRSTKHPHVGNCVKRF